MPHPQVSGYLLNTQLPFQIQTFPRPHLTYSNRIRLSKRIGWYRILGLHVVVRLMESGYDFPASSDSKISGFTVHALSDSLRIYFFHSGGRIKNNPDSLPNWPDACGRTPYPERKRWGFKNIRIRVEGALVLCSRYKYKCYTRYNGRAHGHRVEMSLITPPTAANTFQIRAQICYLYSRKPFCRTGRRAYAKLPHSLFHWWIYWLWQLDNKSLISCFGV